MGSVSVSQSKRNSPQDATSWAALTKSSLGQGTTGVVSFGGDLVLLVAIGALVGGKAPACVCCGGCSFC